MNYRVGIFGFLPARELASNSSLNVGIKDIGAAFEWVRKYIRIFGGDPTRITGFGFSSGAVSIATLLLANDGTLDLFDSAALHSGSVLPLLENVDSARGIVKMVARLSNCTASANLISCLRKVDAVLLNRISEITNKAFNR